MVSKSITIVLTMLFVLYSNSVSVVWMLYFYEKDDIILYFCPYDSQTGGNGTCYIQKILDGDSSSARSKTTTPRILISEENSSYLFEEETDSLVLPDSPMYFGENIQSIRSGFRPLVFRPPLS